MSNTDKPKDESLIPLSEERSLITRSASLAKRGLESLQSHYRTVRFPDYLQIGNAYIFPPDINVLDWEAVFWWSMSRQKRKSLDYQQIESVTGDLRIPYEHNLMLEIEDEGSIADSKLPSLSALLPSDLQGLDVGLQDVDLKDVAYFTDVTQREAAGLA